MAWYTRVAGVLLTGEVSTGYSDSRFGFRDYLHDQFMIRIGRLSYLESDKSFVVLSHLIISFLSH